MYSRTIDFLNQNWVSWPTQYGFTPKQSTVHAILDVASTWLDNVENEKFNGSLPLDLTKAFNTVQHKILLAKLSHYDFWGAVNNFLESYLTNRSQTGIIHDDHSSKSNINIKVSQGSSLGSLQFLLHINDLFNCISSSPWLFCWWHVHSTVDKADISNELDYTV